MLNDDKRQLRGVRRLGLMGGTFDPIHHAHLLLAETALAAFDLDRVVFIPSRRPPHKVSQAELDAEHRACMTQLAIQDEPAFFLSRTELEREGYSYAYDTLVYLRELLPPEGEIYFITGADSILEVDKWYRAAELPALSRFVAAARPGFDLSGLAALPEAWRQVIDVMEMPLMEISSTEIRRRVRAGESIKYLLPPAVEDYIYQQGLYAPEPLDRAYARRRVRRQISAKRFRHCLGVAALAEEWAAHWGLDPERAYLAGLLHDMAREKSEQELLDLARDFGVPLDAAILDNPVLLHGPVAAGLARRDWGLNDPALLEAIACHTIPEPEMGPLAKIIYLADGCDPNRPAWPGREALVALCRQDLDLAMVRAMEGTLAYLRDRGETPHPGTLEKLAAFRRKAEERKGQTEVYHD